MELGGDGVEGGLFGDGRFELEKRLHSALFGVHQDARYQVGEDPDAVHGGDLQTGVKDQAGELFGGEAAGHRVALAPAAVRVGEQGPGLGPGPDGGLHLLGDLGDEVDELLHPPEQGGGEVLVGGDGAEDPLPAARDVALVGAWKADTVGNLVYRKTARNFGPVMATAAELVIVEVASVVDAGQIDPETVVTPGIYVDRVLNLSALSDATEAAS